MNIFPVANLIFNFWRSFVMSMTVYPFFHYVFSSSVYFLYILLKLSCYDDGICVCWNFSISWYTKLVKIISDAQFSLNNSVNLVVIIVLCFWFTEFFHNWFTEHDFLISIKRFFPLIFWNRFNNFIDNFWS